MTILNVGATSTYPSIAAAMVVAAPGDTVLLESGYSNETASVTRSGLTISGGATSLGIVLQLVVGDANFTAAGTAPFTIVDAADSNGIVGNAGDNTITVSAGVDAVDGGAGTDRLIVDYHLATGSVTGNSHSNFTEAGGGGRSVTITDGTIENFTVLTGSGADTITTGDGNDIIDVGSGANTVTVGNGNDSVTGGINADTITVGNGNDTIAGGDGVNTIVAGDGANRITGGSDADTITAGDGGNLVDGGNGTNVLTTGSGNDTILSGTGTDIIAVGGGNDVITLTGGTDTVNAGAGTDRLVINYSAMTTAVTGGVVSGSLVAGYAGHIADAAGSSVDFLGAEDFTITNGTGADIITTGDGTDIINVGSGANTVTAGNGNDSVTGGVDADTITVGNGNDTINAGDGANTVVAGNGANIITGGSGADTFTAGNGGNFIDGGNGTNVLTSGTGNDTIISGVGADSIVAGGGNDVITLVGGADTVNAGAGTDRLVIDYSAMTTAVTGGITSGSLVAGYTGQIIAAAGNSIVFQGAENFSFIGGSGADSIATGAGADTLLGGVGNDSFNGGAGNDSLDGGPGQDVAFFSGTAAQTALAYNLDGSWTLTGPDGTDSLRNIETLTFDDLSIQLPTTTGQTLDLSALGRRDATITILANGIVEVASPGLLNVLRLPQEIRFVDGNVEFTQSSVVAEVTRLYDAAFGRAPDQAGLHSFTTEIEAGRPLADVARAFAATAEFNVLHGNVDNGGFVESLYQSTLHRASDVVGKAAWVSALDSGGISRGDVLLGFSESAEHRNDLSGVVANGIWDLDERAAQVARLYDTGLGRLPDKPGLANWEHALKSGDLTLKQEAAAFAASPEFTSTYSALDDPHFVEQLYVNTLHRASETQGKAGWVNALSSHSLTRAEVLLGFSESSEHIADTAPNINNANAMQFGILFA